MVGLQVVALKRCFSLQNLAGRMRSERCHEVAVRGRRARRGLQAA
jgi:hypothetical protein